MSGLCPVDTHSLLVETFCLLQPVFPDFLRTLLGIWRNSFWILSVNFTKKKKCVFSRCLLFSWHFIGYTFARQEEAYSTTIFLRDRCRRHYWPNSIIWAVVMQYKSLETYRFRDTWTFYKLSFFKETKGYFCLHSIPGQADLFFSMRLSKNGCFGYISRHLGQEEFQCKHFLTGYIIAVQCHCPIFRHVSGIPPAAGGSSAPWLSHVVACLGRMNWRHIKVLGPHWLSLCC